MPVRQAVKIIDVAAVLGASETGPFDFAPYAVRALAQGDSWFSIGAFPPGLTSNLLIELETARPTVVVQCASPGKVMRRFMDTTREHGFLSMMEGPVSSRWDVILISGMGNDIIEAVGSDPTEPPQRRILRTPAERGTGALPAIDFISPPGWQAFASHVSAVFHQLVDLRDRGPNRHVPLVMHNYARVMPRPAGAGLGQGPWLHPAFDAYAVPPHRRLALADELLGRVSLLIESLIEARCAADPACRLYLVDTLHSADVTIAETGNEGSSGDWINEIHLTRAGYRKCAQRWAELLDGITI